MSDSLINKENEEVINEMEGKYNQAKNQTKIKALIRKNNFIFFLQSLAYLRFSYRLLAPPTILKTQKEYLKQNSD